MVRDVDFKGRIIKERDVWDRDFKSSDFDKKLVGKFAYRHRGSVRLSAGLFYTREEWEEKRKKLAAKSLP